MDKKPVTVSEANKDLNEVEETVRAKSKLVVEADELLPEEVLEDDARIADLLRWFGNC